MFQRCLATGTSLFFCDLPKALGAQMHRNGGFTLIELLIVVTISGIIAAIGIPGLLRARQSGNEASAIGSIRSTTSGQTAFSSSCGGGGYAETLDALLTGAPGGAPFISPDVAPVKSGYLIANTGRSGVVIAAAATCNLIADSRSEYLVTASPVSLGSTGQRSFGSDHQGTIYQDQTGAVLTAPLTAGGSISVLQ